MKLVRVRRLDVVDQILPHSSGKLGASSASPDTLLHALGDSSEKSRKLLCIGTVVAPDVVVATAT
eukprot:9121644-Pyramimonas_sp.AAC.1